MPHDDLNPNAFYGGGLAVESYDLFAAQNSNLAGDIDFYLDLARDRGGKVLELACGTGRILTPLVEAGFEVTGVDISRAMLDLADRKLQALRPSA
ncbi:MAG: class I SAM-dependent methyltransferase, partial [Phenylobacterium sp.]|nr:class I SAM-dependent methyltransferase [Phenylobacterium sp.]